MSPSRKKALRRMCQNGEHGNQHKVLGCAGYLGHLFTKSKGCTKTMALIAHLACTTRCRRMMSPFSTPRLCPFLIRCITSKPRPRSPRGLHRKETHPWLDAPVDEAVILLDEII
jgi:hypothetical protein